jgi:hypothetical protein
MELRKMNGLSAFIKDEHMEQQERIASLFTDPANGVPVEKVCVSDLIDPAYQRGDEKRTSRHLVESAFDPDMYEVITVAKVDAMVEGDEFYVPDQALGVNRSGALYEVIDGGHRVRGAIHLSTPSAKIYARVLRDTSRSRRIELFGKLNRQRTPVHALDLFHARVVDGQEGPVKLDKIIKEAGFHLGRTAAKQRPNQLAGITQILKVVKISDNYSDGGAYNEDAMEAFKRSLLVNKLVWGDTARQVNPREQRNNSAVIAGLARVLRDCVRYDKPITVDDVIKGLKESKIGYGPNGFVLPSDVIEGAAKFRSKGATTGGGDHLVVPARQYLIEAINSGLGVQNKNGELRKGKISDDLVKVRGDEEVTE